MKNIKQQLEALYAEAEFQKLFESLNYYLLDESEGKQELLHLNFRFNEIKRKVLGGTITLQDELMVKNQIGVGLLEIIKNLTENTTASTSRTNSASTEMSEAIGSKPFDEKFLVVSQSEKSRDELHFYFSHLGLKNFDCKILSQKEPADEYLFIVFDAFEIKNPNNAPRVDDNYLSILSSYLADGQLVVYYGKTWDRLDEYRNQVHAANSRFSLYHRVMEMKEVINKFNLKPSPPSANS